MNEVIVITYLMLLIELFEGFSKFCARQIIPICLDQNVNKICSYLNAPGCSLILPVLTLWSDYCQGAS